MFQYNSVVECGIVLDLVLDVINLDVARKSETKQVLINLPCVDLVWKS